MDDLLVNNGILPPLPGISNQLPTMGTAVPTPPTMQTSPTVADFQQAQPLPSSTVAASILPPLPTQPTFPPSTIAPPVENIPQKPKGNFMKKVIVFIIVLAILGSIGVGGTFAYNSMRTQFNPALSPIVEDILYSPGQQLIARLNLLIDTGAVGVASEMTDLKYPIDTDFSVEEMALYKKNVGSKINDVELSFDTKSTFELEAPISNVLGITSAPGKIDQAFISDLTSAKKFTILMSGTQSLEFKDRKNPKSKGTFGLQLELPSSQISTSMDTLLLNKVSYLMLKSFPENDYIDFSTIINKWLQLDSVATPTSAIPEDVSASPVEIKKKDIENIKAVLSVEELSSRIKSAPSATINGVQAKCYSLTLDTIAAKEIATAMEAKSVELGMTKATTSNAISEGVTKTDTATTDTTLCFAGNQFIPTKFVTNSNYIDQKNKYLITTTLVFSPLSVDTSFTIPDASSIIKIEEVDPTKLLKPAAIDLMGNLIPGQAGEDALGAPGRNTRRSADVTQILNAVTQYTSEQGHALSDLGKIPLCTASAAHISNIPLGPFPAGTVNLAPKLADIYIATIPKDPLSGTDKDTGYTICKTSSGGVQVGAPLAEEGKTILVKR